MKIAIHKPETVVRALQLSPDRAEIYYAKPTNIGEAYRIRWSWYTGDGQRHDSLREASQHLVKAYSVRGEAMRSLSPEDIEEITKKLELSTKKWHEVRGGTNKEKKALTRVGATARVVQDIDEDAELYQILELLLDKVTRKKQDSKKVGGGEGKPATTHQQRRDT